MQVFEASTSTQSRLSTNAVAGTKLANITAAIGTKPATARGMPHHRRAFEGARPPADGPGTLGCCVGITDVTTAAAWIVGLAIVSMIAAGWRKVARATADPARARRPGRAPVGIPLEDVHAPLYRPASIWRRVWSLMAGSAIAVVTGALLATFLGFGFAYAVVRFSDMLKK
jgi:ABC-type Fe3+ transport system permease subunit